MPTQVRLWDDVLYTLFDTGTLDGFKGAVNLWLLLSVVFSGACCVLFCCVAQVLVGFRKQFINNVVFPTWACAAGFNTKIIIRGVCLMMVCVLFDFT